MTFTLGSVGWSIVVLSVVGAIVAGRWNARKSQDQSDQGGLGFILAGRSLTAPLFAVTLIATWYGSVMASGEFIVRNGVMFLLCFGVPYYITALCYALFLSKRIRRSSAITIPASITETFGKSAGLAASVAVLVISIPAPYMLSLGIVLQVLTEWPLWVCIVLGTACSLVIVAKGGLRSDVAANVVQLTLMYGGFAALAIGCVVAFGGVGTMVSALPASTFHIPGTVGWSGVFVWLLISLQTFVDPNFHMRSAAARSPREAKLGMLLSVAGWVLFDILQVAVGLYGVAFVSSNDAQWHFLSVAQAVLPDVLKGLFVASIIAAVMSTLDGYALVSATTIGHDIMGMLSSKGSAKRRLYLALLLTGIGGTIAAITVSSIVDLIMLAASVAVPGLMLPLIASVWHPLRTVMRKQRGLPAWILIVLPCVVATVTVIFNKTSGKVVEPMFTGLLASIILFPLTRIPNAANK